jgi:hypothetical protein
MAMAAATESTPVGRINLSWPREEGCIRPEIGRRGRLREAPVCVGHAEQVVDGSQAAAGDLAGSVIAVVEDFVDAAAIPRAVSTWVLPVPAGPG